MRKLITLTVAGLLAFAAVAFAVQQNTYSVSGSVTPLDSGTKTNPKPSGLKFGYTVGEQDGKRPGLISKYSIHFAGMIVNTNFFKGCSAAKINQDLSDVNCPAQSLMGTGSLEAVGGSSGDETSQPEELECHLDIKVYNSRNNKAAIYLKGIPGDPRGPEKDCAIEINEAIDASFVRNATGTALQFSVSSTLLHPVNGIDVAVKNVTSTIPKKTKKVNGKTRGWFESTGRCINKKRAITVTFTPEDSSQPSAKSQKLAACTP